MALFLSFFELYLQGRFWNKVQIPIICDVNIIFIIFEVETWLHFYVSFHRCYNFFVWINHFVCSVLFSFFELRQKDAICVGQVATHCDLRIVIVVRGFSVCRYCGTFQRICKFFETRGDVVTTLAEVNNQVLSVLQLEINAPDWLLKQFY